MAKELVKHYNDFNKIKILNFTAQEQNILMGIISKIRDLHNDEIITIYPNELKEFSTHNYTNNEFLNVIRMLRDKFFKADFTILINDTERNIFAEKIINLFNEFTIYRYVETLEIERVELSVNTEFSYLLKDLLGSFTSFELPKFKALKSKYSKSLYRILKQYKNTGKCLIYKNDWQGFCDFMNIPASYKACDIDKLILKPAILELGGERNLFAEIDNKTPIFENLSYKKIKDPKGRGRGGKVIGIEFYFTAQQEAKQEQKQAIAKQGNESKVKFIGQAAGALDAYLDWHFKSHNKLLNIDDICKIKDITQNSDGSITTRNLNQDDNSYFNMKFESFKNFKNWLEKCKL